MFVLLNVFFIAFVLFSRGKKRGTLWALFFSSLTFLYLAVSLFYYLADYFTNEGLNEAVVYTLLSGLEGTDYTEYSTLIVSAFVFTVSMIAASYLYYRMMKKNVQPKVNIAGNFLHIYFLCIAYLSHPFFHDLKKIY